MRFSGITTAVIASLAAFSLPEPSRAQSLGGTPLSSSRIVHRFDFDERDRGNLEDIPKFWEPLRPAGFPHYAKGSFDYDVGRSAPPSFHLASEGRHVAFQYVGHDTHVRANTDYRIEGYVRPDQLRTARACLSAHYLDKSGRPLTETVVRSAFVGGPASPDDWIRFELHLASASAEAYSIGLVGWVLQESQWSAATPRRRHVPRSDVRGGAWFDDITIYALPQAAVATHRPGNIYTADGPQELEIVLADNEGVGIEGRFSIVRADGTVWGKRAFSVERGESPDPVRVPIGHLSPGVYSAELDVFAAGTHVVSRSLTFARLSPLRGGPDRLARSFGVVVDPRFRTDPAVELELLRHQAVGTVKLPIWTGLPDRQDSAADRRATDRLLQSLVKRGVVLGGVFFGPPAAVVRDGGAYARSLADVLASDPAAWSQHLASVVAPYASTFRWWQVGPETGLQAASEDELIRAVTQLRDAMEPFISMPRLSLPVSSSLHPGADKLPVNRVSTTIGSEIGIKEMAPQIRRLKDLGYEQVSVHVAPLPRGQFRRLPRLADWAQRIITARHAGAAAVFVPQTWQVREAAQGQQVDPQETFLVLRTIADLLGDASPGPVLRVAGGVVCLAFHNGVTTVLAMWDPHAPPEGKRYALQMGRADRQVDIWGVSKPFDRDDRGRQTVLLGPTPIFVPGVERWLIDFRTSITITPTHVESGDELVVHAIEMAYRGNRPVFGQFNLKPPEEWQVTPRTFSFALNARRTDVHNVEVRYPHSEAAGEKEMRARITLDSESYYLEVPLALDLGLADIDVWGLAVVKGEDLVLRHVVTNRSQEIVSFRASAGVPGRERQHRPIPNLRPGDTQIVQYRFSQGRELIGRDARLMLREVNDGPRMHNLDQRIP